MCLRDALIYVLLLLAFSVQAQEVKLEFYTTEDGLSSNRIWNVAYDDHGLVWLASDALNHFDGQTFLNYTTRKEPIFQRFTDDNAIHIIGTKIYYWEGRVLIEGSTTTGERQELRLDSILSPDAVLSTARSYQTTDQDLLLFFLHVDRQAFELVRFSPAGFVTVGTISDAHVDTYFQKPVVFVSRQGCVMYLDTSGTQVVEVDLFGKTQRKVRLSGLQGVSITPGLHHETIMLNGNRVYYLNSGNTVFREHSINPQLAAAGVGGLTRMAELENGDLWLIGEDRRLFHYNVQTDMLTGFRQQVSEVIPYQQALADITPDPSGVLWINATTGLLKVKPKRSLFQTYFTGQRSECQGQCSFRGITEDDDGRIYASYYSNIFRIDTERESVSGPLINESITPFDLVYSNSGLINNLGYLIDPDLGKMTNPFLASGNSADLGTFARDDVNGLWRCYDNEVFYLDNTTAYPPQWVKVLIVGAQVNDIVFDSTRKLLWLAGRGWLRQYRNANGRLALLREVGFDPTLIIRKIHCSTSGYLWLATESGLIRYDPEDDGRIQYTIHNGLPSNLTVTILPEGDSCLWIGTHNGLSRFNIRQETFVNFFTEDGLASNECNRRSAYLAKNGRMYFGGVGGLTAFYPAELMQHYYNAPRPGQLVLTALSKTDVRSDTTTTAVFATGDEIRIYPYHKSLRFEFRLTDYYDTDRIQYSYQLDGFDNVWSRPSSEHTAVFNYLPAGKYVFRVRAQSAQGQWHESQLAVPLIVYAPWYARWWTYGMYALAILAAGIATFLVQRKRWELRSDLKLKQAEADNLKKLDSFKSKLYTNITHEFRTPLTVILGMSRKIRQSDKNDIHDAAQLIENNGQSLLQLVNQLLDLSKLENHAVRLQLQHKDIVSYTKYIVQSFQSYANSQNMSIRFTSGADTLEIDFDQIRLKQVMVNLISNALKFTHPGGEIQVALMTSGTPEQLAISVEDKGIGISREDLPYIFDRFYQANGTATNVNVGTGIGLAHTKELVKLMGGEITVSSEPDKGSIFTVLLPVTHTMQGAPRTDDTTLLESTMIPSPVANDLSEKEYEDTESDLPRLLIIEDNADVVVYLKSCIAHLYHVRVAYSGRIGIEMARREIPDLIISDIMMPEVDGYEVCDTLKQDVYTCHIPIILLTAKVDSESRLSGLKKGADAYLQKPFDQDELIAILANMIAMRKRWVRWFSQEAGHLEEIPEGAPLSGMEREFIARIHAIVTENYADENFSLPQLCQKIGMSRSQLFRKMKALTDISPSHYIRKYRLEQGRKLLESGDLNVSQVAWQVGFRHVSHFTKSFKEEYGVTPSATQK